MWNFPKWKLIQPLKVGGHRPTRLYLTKVHKTVVFALLRFPLWTRQLGLRGCHLIWMIHKRENTINGRGKDTNISITPQLLPALHFIHQFQLGTNISDSNISPGIRALRGRCSWSERSIESRMEFWSSLWATVSLVSLWSWNIYKTSISFAGVQVCSSVF